MSNYNFLLVLSGITEPTEKLEDALFEAGCDDATLSFCNQLAYLEFDREALSFTEAVISAIKQVQSIDKGINVERVEPNELLVVNGVEPNELLKASQVVRSTDLAGDVKDVC